MLKATMTIASTIGAHGTIEDTVSRMKFLYPELKITVCTTGGWFSKTHLIRAEGKDDDVEAWVEATRQWARSNGIA